MYTQRQVMAITVGKRMPPYQGIIVTAGVESVPSALIEQLAVPGKLVIPVTSSLGSMDLFCY